MQKRMLFSCKRVQPLHKGVPGNGANAWEQFALRYGEHDFPRCLFL